MDEPTRFLLANVAAVCASGPPHDGEIVTGGLRLARLPSGVEQPKVARW
jgi:hypothetical protein